MAKNLGGIRTKFNEKFELYFEKQNQDGTTQKMTPAEKGLCKDMEISVLVKRQIYGADFLPKTGYFVQALSLHVPAERAYRYIYFCKERGMENVAVINFSPALKNMVGLTYLLDLNNEDFCKKHGKAKKITIEDARKMLIDKTALCMFNDEALTMEIL